ncbi:uncharacterized protein VTP21DRAFT_10901 [Calcarisporiella thermophila]|uniref:uncharacterized protein n=1 Tax=Calcarisporiella thermophila TaxID=911321 RepID=UPI0037435CCC
MRIFCIPIARNHWAFYCHSTLPATSRLSQWVAWASRKWDSLSTSEPKSFKGRVYATGNNLLDRMEHEEWFLKGVPMKEDWVGSTTRVPLLHPSKIPGNVVSDHLDDLIKRRLPYHRRYMIYSALWIPLSVSFTLVPLIPNFPLAYNLFRLYSHYKAFKGAQHLQYLRQHQRIDLQSEVTVDRCLESLSFDGSTNNITYDVSGGILEEERVHELSKAFELPGLDHDIRRALHQVKNKLEAKDKRP